jgi:hypothetical protein
MVPVLRGIQSFTGEAIERTEPEMGENLHRYANLAVAVNAAQRQIKLRGDKPSWRLGLARFLKRVGANGAAVAVANSEVRGWQR